MIFAKDTFSRDFGKWTDVHSSGVITFPSGVKRYKKVSTDTKSWTNLGSIFGEERVLETGDRFTLKFQPKTFTEGLPSDANATFWQAGLVLDNPNLIASGYGLYLEGNAFRPLNSSPVAGHDVAVDTDKRYTLVLEVLPDSNLGMWFGPQGNVTPLYTIPGPFLGRSAWFYFNLYSLDTVDLIDFIGKDIEG